MSESGEKWEVVEMFRGINGVNLDAKGRLAVPSRYRQPLIKQADGQLILTIDTESPCLLLYPAGEWELIEQKLEQLPSFNPQARRIQRLLIGHATDVEMDANGRILVPPLLRDYAKFDKKVMLVGQGKKFELWDEKVWEQGRGEWLTASSTQDGLPQELQSLSL